MSSKKIINFKNGTVSGFSDEIDLSVFEINSSKKIRVSRIIPKSILLRTLFKLLRATSNDQSRIAKWTRTWSCDWLVEIDRKHFGPFKDRSKAISFEKQYLIEQGVLTSDR